jgi:hypothetical protein
VGGCLYTGSAMNLRLPALVAALSAAAGASSAAPPTAKTTTTATTAETTPVTRAADRAIFDDELSREKWGFMFRLPTEFWTPSAAEIAKMEVRLPDYLRDQLAPHPARRPGPRDRAPARRRPAPEPPSRLAAVPLWKRAYAYKRQYVGLVKQGHHVIWGNFFCQPPRSDWRHEPVLVDDGGDCFFHVEYDVDAGRFSDLVVNGEA